MTAMSSSPTGSYGSKTTPGSLHAMQEKKRSVATALNGTAMRMAVPNAWPLGNMRDTKRYNGLRTYL